jgi:hypothetical protein
LLLMLAFGIAPAAAQQNQTPGDLTAGGASQSERTAASAQAGANTTDGTTTGSSGPKKQQSGPPGNLELPPLPSAKLCESYDGDVQLACLATVTNGSAAAVNGAQQ